MERDVSLDEEHLDFEPEFGEELSHDVEEQSQLHSDESTVKLLYSDDREVDRFSNATVGDSISTMSISHRR
ncbi:hypothetical protein NQ314_006943 [Rhamnusium bicolor]|uniref:Uncharacterized protein n=1 Tax=Rhamnusium bicolor TaxID=1586634 RepID=A0AAV8YUB3_9CUCU|nr:hypothetical protein NQ314_006943 [Rhamnusium bicolor]